MPENWTVGQRGKIFRNDTKESTAENAENAEKELKLKNSATSVSSAVKQFVGFVRCPIATSVRVKRLSVFRRTPFILAEPVVIFRIYNREFALR
ncbi:unnamed protein product [marine sediment metagenome]|uniref:Uncharacterized protein n=1 Tax=marine sediment metagenome TaxID=412755 RepID=X1RAG7_9ZZZZ